MNQQNNDYLARLGLETDPFPAGSDSSMYYENEDLMQRLDMIQHLLGFSNQMVFITGENGIGKTAMLDRLEYYAPDHWRICRIQATSMLNMPILLRQLTSGFELEVTADADDMLQVYSEALQDHIESLERSMLTPVVLIDDAHELPIDAFTMLFGFMQQEGGHSRMKMALFCEPQILTMLDSPRLKTLSQNLTHQLEIPPFDERQTQEYLEQRLTHAGLAGDFPFLPEAVQKIHRDSQGVAGKIHTLAQQALLNEDSQTNYGSEDGMSDLPVVDEILEFEDEAEEAFPAMSTARAKLEKTMPIGTKFHTWQIGAVAAVLAVLAGILWLTSQFGNDTEPSIAEEIHLDITPENTMPESMDTVVAQQPTVQDPTLFDESTQLPQAVTTTEQINDQTIPTDQASTETTTTIDPLDDFVQSMEENQHQQESDHPADANHQHSEVTVQIDENGQAQIVEVSQSDLPMAVTEPVQKSVPEPVIVPEPITEPTPETVVAAVETVIETPVAVVQTEPEPVKPQATKPTTTQKPSISGIKGEDWLRTQNSAHVLLQLLGTHDQVALKKIISESSMGDDVAWFTTIHAGQPWYVVVKGPYKDRAAAASAVASLPEDLKKRKPWPRSVADVKKAMGEAP